VISSFFNLLWFVGIGGVYHWSLVVVRLVYPLTLIHLMNSLHAPYTFFGRGVRQATYAPSAWASGFPFAASD
jgi:hypothetical protein